METLIVVDQHKNQYYSTTTRSKPHSSPFRDFRAINCRTFQSSTGILPTPLKSHSFNSPKTPSSPKPAKFSTPDNKLLGKKISPKSTPIAISGKGCIKERTFSEDVTGGSFSLSELWAGPTYSNSPPPSSLPIPKFSVRPKRTVSLELPGPDSYREVEMRPGAKSAPASPSREYYPPPTRGRFVNADSATKTLCRILNLNISDG